MAAGLSKCPFFGTPVVDLICWGALDAALARMAIPQFPASQHFHVAFMPDRFMKLHQLATRHYAFEGPMLVLAVAADMPN